MRHMLLLATLLSAVPAFASGKPHMTAERYLEALSREVAQGGAILGPDYSYQEWVELKRKSSQAAIDAAEDRDREFHLWDQAEKALKEMELFSTGVNVSRGAGLNPEQKAKLERVLAQALGRLELDGNEALRRHYAARLAQGEYARQAHQKEQAAYEKSKALQAQARGGAERVKGFAAEPAGRRFDESAQRRDLEEREESAPRRENYRSPPSESPRARALEQEEKEREREREQPRGYTNEPEKLRLQKGGAKVPEIPTERALAFQKGFKEGRKLDEPRKVLTQGMGIAGAGVAVYVAGAVMAPVAVPVAVTVAAGALVVGGVVWVASQMPEGGWQNLMDGKPLPRKD